MKILIFIPLALLCLTSFAQDGSKPVPAKTPPANSTIGKPEAGNTKKNKEDTVVTIPYDMENFKTRGHQKINRHTTVEVIIKNINQYAYDVSIDTVHNRTANTPVPPLFADLTKLPSLEEVKTDPPKVAASSADVGARPAVRNAIKSFDEKSKKLTAFLTKYKSAETTLKSLLNTAGLPSRLDEYLKDCADPFAEIKIKAKLMISKDLGLDTALLPAGIKDEVEKRVSGFTKTLSELTSEGTAMLAEFPKLLEGAKDLKDYREIEKMIKTKSAEINTPLENVKKMQTKAEEFKNGDIGGQTKIVYDKIMTSRRTMIFSASPKFNTDELVYKVKITPKEGIQCRPIISSFDVKATVIGGVKVDFSTGAVANIGTNKFFDQKYRKDPVYRANGASADSITIEQNTNNNKLALSLGAFMNIYTRVSSDINIGGVAGVSVGDQQKVYWHLGGSVLIGKSSRWIISSGVSISKSDILDGQYKVGQVLKNSLLTGDIPTEKATRLGGFVSLSWNLNLIPGF